MTVIDLGQKSVRRNALIADLLHRIGFIEKAGTGIRRMREEAHEHGCLEPSFEETGFFSTTFSPNPEVRLEVGAQSGAQSEQVLEILGIGTCSAGELAVKTGAASKSGAMKRTLTKLITQGYIEYTIPDKPTSRLQRYRITETGRKVLMELKEAQR
jgi:ATP-dependent DNA helicase RecG